MRQNMKISSFKMWRARVTGRKTKHLQLRSTDVIRAYCSGQYKRFYVFDFDKRLDLRLHRSEQYRTSAQQPCHFFAPSKRSQIMRTDFLREILFFHRL